MTDLLSHPRHSLDAARSWNEGGDTRGEAMREFFDVERDRHIEEAVRATKRLMFQLPW